MNNNLIGVPGFAGSTLIKQVPFESLYRSTNISEIQGISFDIVVRAGAPAQKWIANRDPEADRQKIEDQYSRRETIQAARAYAQVEPRTLKSVQGASA